MALQWERRYGNGRPAIMRYDSKYCAMLACGTWRARKNKKLAAVAREEWRELRAALKGLLWLKHVKGHSGHKWNDRADALADAGAGGVIKTGEPDSELVD